MSGFVLRAAINSMAFVPIAIILCISAYLGKDYCFSYAMIFATILLCILSVFARLFFFSEWGPQKVSLKFSDAEPIQSEVIMTLIIYGAPFYGNTHVEIQVWLLALFVVVLLLSFRSPYAIYFNPILELAGWHHFRLTKTNGEKIILIARKKPQRDSEKSGIVSAKSLTQFIYFAT